MYLEHFSLITTPVSLLRGEQEVLQGTGFYFAKKVQQEPEALVLCLVTNQHVLTGHSPSESKPPKGDNIIFYVHTKKDSPGNVKQIRFPLFTRNNQQTWLGCGSCPEADLAIIPMPRALYSDAYISCISKDYMVGDVRIRPTATVTLVGYPYGYYDHANCLPVWKTGSIASEPDVDFNNKPLFLVDVSAFPGMSGSPTFAIAHGAYEMGNGTMTVGHVQKFLGIFASMQIREENKYLEEIASESKKGFVLEHSLQLGHIWKARLIAEVIDGLDVQRYESEIMRNLP